MSDFVISKCIAREVLDSRGNPTVEVEMCTKQICASAIVPSGASTGTYEALELRDNDERFHGKGVQKAVKNVGLISKQIVGLDVREQEKLDDLMIKLDGTKNKSVLGANAILGVSMAAARLAAKLQGVELWQYLSKLAGTKPRMAVPFSNVINGGAHAGSELPIQEFMITPQGKNINENVRMVSEVYHSLKKLLVKEYGKMAANVGDEGGFAPPIKTGDEALRLLTSAIEASGYTGKVRVAVDAAASGFFSDGKYKLEQSYSPTHLVDYWEGLVKKYGIYSLEDPFAEDDFEGWRLATERMGGKMQIVGDDLLVTNVDRIHMAIQGKLCNALLLKVNQIGSLTEAIAAANLAFKNGWKVMVSHRSGETEDTFIADLAVGLGCGQIKLGAPCRSERTAKYNRLLRIGETL
jgi:enolase